MSKHVTWAKLVKKRDNHQCQMCSSTDRVTAHHIFCAAEYPSLSTDLDNGVTLCYQCHWEFHVLFLGGWGHPCTYDDYDEWVAIRTKFKNRSKIERSMAVLSARTNFTWQ